jgi:hypothetical protein
MKTLYLAALLAFVTVVASGCTTGSALPAVSAPAAKKADAHRAIAPNGCQPDSGGIMTGDGQDCA